MKRTIEIEFDDNDDGDGTMYLGFAVYRDSCVRKVLCKHCIQDSRKFLVQLFFHRQKILGLYCSVNSETNMLNAKNMNRYSRKLDAITKMWMM